VDDLSRSLEIKVSDLKQQSESDTHRLGQNVNDVLAADDKLLTSLEKLGAELNLLGAEDDRTVDALRQVCMRYGCLSDPRVPPFFCAHPGLGLLTKTFVSIGLSSALLR
jgi:seryl-tRNA synthetase